MAPKCCYEVRSEKTAIARPFPVPAKRAYEAGIIRRGASVFDYGEGKGGLCRTLRKKGITCRGWDPSFSPANPKTRADVVTINFVLNVICNPNDRAKALREAYGLAREALVVGLRPKSEEKGTKSKEPCGDGWLVKKGRSVTFQKFHTVDEAVGYVERVLGRQAQVLARDPVVLVVKKRR